MAFFGPPNPGPNSLSERSNCVYQISGPLQPGGHCKRQRRAGLAGANTFIKRANHPRIASRSARNDAGLPRDAYSMMGDTERRCQDVQTSAAWRSRSGLAFRREAGHIVANEPSVQETCDRNWLCPNPGRSRPS
jgi:hypothetical protein